MIEYDLIIVGGGASGIATAISARKNNKKISILIIESLNKLGKKILASGNGRCNICNKNKYIYYGDKKFANTVLGKNAYTNLEIFLNELGINIVSDSEGRCYPSSYQSETVMDAFNNFIINNKIDIKLSTKVKDIKIDKNIFFIKTDNYNYKSKKLVISVGGKSYPALGTDGYLYPILSNLGIKFSDFYPSLCPMCTEKKDVNGLSGLRVKCTISANHHSYRGELLFTDYGLSGISVMQLSRFCKECSILSIDLSEACGLQDKSHNEKIEYFISRRNTFFNFSVESMLIGILNLKIAKKILQNIFNDFSKLKCKDLKDNDINHLVDQLENFKIKITSSRGFDYAQVTSGGIICSQVDPNTMMSYIKNLYFTGEVLNVDGDTGGYNLMFALTTGIKAGKSIGLKEN